VTWHFSMTQPSGDFLQNLVDDAMTKGFIDFL